MAGTQISTGVSEISAPSDSPNNQDVFVWALYRKGGDTTWIDVEEIYLHCFELAPARLGWRSHPEIPDYKKCAKALQSVEASTHVGLIVKQGQYQRRLSAAGIAWCETHSDALSAIYEGATPVRASNAHDTSERRRREVRGHPVFQDWLQTRNPPEIWDIAAVLTCSTGSTNEIWNVRIGELDIAAKQTSDEELADFVTTIRTARQESK